MRASTQAGLGTFIVPPSWNPEPKITRAQLNAGAEALYECYHRQLPEEQLPWSELSSREQIYDKLMAYAVLIGAGFEIEDIEEDEND